MPEAKQNFLTRLLLKMAAATSSSTFGPMDHEMVRRAFGSDASVSGKAVTPESALMLSTAWSCMRVLSETIGSLPVAIYKRDTEGGMEKATEHPLHYLLAVSPNRDMTSTEFREAMVLSLCQAGNFYAEIQRTGSIVSALWPIDPKRVRPMRRGGTGEIYYKITQPDGSQRDYPQSEIWHVKGFGDGLVGLSPLAAARESMGFALAVEEFGARFFAQGGKPSGTVTIPNFLTKDQREIARNNLQQLMSGMGNMHKFALFEGGMKPEPWGAMPLEDMQFLMLRKFSVQDVCRWYRVPPHMVADLDKATFSNIEQQAQEFVNYTLMPYFTRIEASAAKWLMSAKDAAQYVLRFNAEGLLRGDSAARAALYPVLLQNGVLTRNEVRALENRNRSSAEGMDDHTVQLNMTPISSLPALIDSQISKNNAPPPAPFGGQPAPKEDPEADLSKMH